MQGVIFIGSVHLSVSLFGYEPILLRLLRDSTWPKDQVQIMVVSRTVIRMQEFSKDTRDHSSCITSVVFANGSTVPIGGFRSLIASNY